MKIHTSTHGARKQLRKGRSAVTAHTGIVDRFFRFRRLVRAAVAGGVLRRSRSTIRLRSEDVRERIIDGMHTRLAVAITLIAVAVSAAAAFSQPRRPGGVGLTVFTEANFGGRSATFREDVPNLADSGLNDRIVSLRAPRGEYWEVCEHSRYRGRCVVVSGEEPDLSRNGWSNTISSIRRVQRGDAGVDGEEDRGGLVLFARPGFTGERRRVLRAIPDLSELGFDDRAISLRVGRGESWDVCTETRYRDCQRVDEDVRDLREIDLRGRISSVRPR